MGRLGVGLGLMGRSTLKRGPWTPMDLGSKLLAWWDASDASTITVVGGEVSAWTDKKGGVTVTQSTATYRPTMGTVGLQNNPALMFDGVDDYMFSTALGNLAIGSSGSEVWSLLSCTAPPSLTTEIIYFSLGTNSGTTSLRHGAFPSAGVLRYRARLPDGETSRAATDLSKLAAGVHYVRNRVSDGYVGVSVDGGFMSTGLGATPNVGNQRVTIGAGANLYCWSGGICDLIQTTDDLTPSEVASLSAYLRSKVVEDVWTPSELGSKLRLWLDAEDSSTITSASGVVAAWRNKGGIGGSFNQSTIGFRPVVEASGFNGRPQLVFDGTDDYMTGSSGSIGPLSGPMEMWSLLDQRAESGVDIAQRWALRIGASSVTRAGLARVNLSDTSRFRGLASDGTQEHTLNETSVLFQGPHRVRVEVLPNRFQAHIDEAAPLNAWITTNISSGTVYIGSQNTTTFMWLGGINTMLVTDTLTSDEAAKLKAYLDRRKNGYE